MQTASNIFANSLSPGLRYDAESVKLLDIAITSGSTCKSPAPMNRNTAPTLG